jgi:hypothetical protein
MIVPYLQGRFERADIILFSGAGFSNAARSLSGTPVPLGDDLRKMLWRLCYPSEAFDERAELPDLYANALRHQRGALTTLMQEQFTVDRNSLPEHYSLVFSLPWTRVYTLNVDDLAQAVQQTSRLPRPLVSISALTGRIQGAGGHPNPLEVIHLNGCLADGVDKITFSPLQYARRLAALDRYYAQAAVDLLGMPVVFVGTQLDEQPLWQHVELRRQAAGRDLRRRSVFVLPSLSRPRRELLEQEFHVEHVALSAEKFAVEVLGQMADAARKGQELLAARTAQAAALNAIPLAGELASAEKSVGPSQYLFGATPMWSDIRGGRAAQREIDKELSKTVRVCLEQPGPRPVVIVTGTAGSGKSTACMRCALATSAEGTNVGWIDMYTDASPVDVRQLMSSDTHPPVLMIDDADRYGNEVALLARDLAAGPGHPVVVLAIRSGRVERVADRLRLIGAPQLELVMPNLSDPDIDALLEVLARENRLGELTALSHARQVDAFRRRSDRQLLVAMIEATSGRRFEEKIIEELHQLVGMHRYVYAIVAIATAVRVGLARNDILHALEAPDNESLQVINDLIRRLLINEREGDFRVRHRMIGERIVDALAADHSLADPISGMCRACAVALSPSARRGSVAYRRMRTLMNHDWLIHLVQKEGARQVLGELEPYMSWDHHYWLQRGSVELESEELDLAENSLNTAASLEPGDLLVQTELGYLLLKLAVREPSGVTSRERLESGQQLLRGVIYSRSHYDPHQYQIYGHQTLLWSQRSDVTPTERERMLADALDIVQEGRKSHPRDERLRELFVMLENERLGLGWAGGHSPE